jgi:hypothetical protein
MDPQNKFAKFTAHVAAGSMLMPVAYGLGDLSARVVRPHDAYVRAIPLGDSLHVDNEAPGIPAHVGVQVTVITTSTAPPWSPSIG